MDAEQQWVCQVDVVRKAKPEDHPDGYMAEHFAPRIGGVAVGILVTVIVVLPFSSAQPLKVLGDSVTDSVRKRLRMEDAVSILYVGEPRVIGKLEDCPWAKPS